MASNRDEVTALTSQAQVDAHQPTRPCFANRISGSRDEDRSSVDTRRSLVASGESGKVVHDGSREGCGFTPAFQSTAEM